MSILAKEVLVSRKINAVLCDFLERSPENPDRIIACKNEGELETLPPSWTMIQLSFRENGPPASWTNKIFHFCPEHAKHTEARLARVMEP